MRKVAAATLAVPVIAVSIVSSLVRRSLVVRAIVVFGLAALVGAGALTITATQPTPTTAAKPLEIVSVPHGEIRTALRAGQATDAAVDITFSAPMDPDSVRASLDVEPPAAVRVGWNAERTVLTVAPLGRWGTGRYYTITVEPGALAASGVPLTTPVRAAFVTRPATTATITLTGGTTDRARPDAVFAVDVDQPLDPATTPGALRITPAVAGAWTVDPDTARGARYVFTPVGRLAADSVYTVELERSVRDLYGGTVAVEPLLVRTAKAPAVVRFRPVDGTADVPRTANLSVRFTESMDRASTEAAFAALVGQAKVPGRLTWAENDTVLLLDPLEALPYEATVVVSVAPTARSADGVPVGATVTGTFTTVEAPAPPPAPVAKTTTAPPSGSGGSGGGSGSSGGSGSPGGGSVGSGSWTAVEAYYLGLMNCTRTGGTVTSGGDCSSPGGRNVAPLALEAGISSKVARPYAKVLATQNHCSHFIGGNPGDRLRRAGYTSYIWAENLGCRSGNPYSAVLGSHLYFQSERSWSPQGGHYVNLMNAKYDRAGIGVWVSGGRVRLVVDFYHPR